MSIVQPGWVKRARRRRRERQWRADMQATVKWAGAVLTVPRLAA